MAVKKTTEIQEVVTTTEDWNSWSKHILTELNRLNVSIENLSKQSTKLQVEIARLKVQAGVWGLAGGAIPVAIAIVVVLLRSM